MSDNTVQKTTQFMIVVVFISSLLMAFAIWATSRGIVARLEALQDNVKAVEEGALEVTVTSEDQDEIGSLIRGFGEMINRIKFLIEEVYESKIKEKNFEMRALQQQINPHFLYNTLSMINFMAIESGQNDISKITLSLSDFYRTALNKGNNTCSLDDELKNMKAYLDIQQMMHDYDFELDIEIDEEIRGYESPNLILQPIVENAIGHGIDLLEERKGVIKVYATENEDQVFIMVEDNGVGMDEETKHRMLNENSKGYGMRNVNQRIKLLYGEEYGLHIESVIGEGTLVTIRLPKIVFKNRNI
jgi:two-component system sensor histidine kinase YesM